MRSKSTRLMWVGRRCCRCHGSPLQDNDLEAPMMASSRCSSFGMSSSLTRSSLMGTRPARGQRVGRLPRRAPRLPLPPRHPDGMRSWRRRQPHLAPRCARGDVLPHGSGVAMRQRSGVSGGGMGSRISSDGGGAAPRPSIRSLGEI